MKGHEYARAQVKAHLQARVPGRLSALKAALSVTTPAAPAAYLLADRLPVDPALYPCIIVNSTGAPRMRAQSVHGKGDTVDYIVVYDLRVVVACRTDLAGGDEAASLDRDRLLLAVREALLSPGTLPADIELVTTDMTEDTGAATQDLRGRPLSAGQVTFSAACLETLTPATVPDALEESAIEVTGYPAATVTITPEPEE